MYRPNKKRILKIGIVLVLVSAVLFSMSMYLLAANSLTRDNINIAPGSSYTLSKIITNTGADIDYTITSTQGSLNVTAYILYGNGATDGYSNVSNQYSISKVIVSKHSGDASLVIVNNGNQTLGLHATLGSIDYVTLITTIFGFVILVSGAGLIALYAYSRYADRKKEKMLREYNG